MGGCSPTLRSVIRKAWAKRSHSTNSRGYLIGKALVHEQNVQIKSLKCKNLHTKIMIVDFKKTGDRHSCEPGRQSAGQMRQHDEKTIMSKVTFITVSKKSLASFTLS